MKVLNILSRTEVGSNLWQPRTKIHQGGLGDSEDESDAKIFSVPDSETGQQSAPLTHPARTDAKAATASLREH